jgi:hypothetical protein
VFVYVKVFANQDAAETWFIENDPEDEVLDCTASVAAPRFRFRFPTACLEAYKAAPIPKGQSIRGRLYALATRRSATSCGISSMAS